MRTVSIFKNGNNRAIRLPRDWILTASASWRSSGKGTASFCVPSGRPRGSFAQLDRADPDFMAEREDVVSDEGRFEP